MSAATKKKRLSTAATPAKDKPLPVVGGQSTVSTPSSPAPNTLQGGGDQRIPLVKFTLADGSKTWAPRLRADRSLESWLPKIIQRLDLDVDPRQVRLAHVREYGREVDMWDDFDLENLKTRAYASPKHTQYVKVYLPSSSTMQTPLSPYPNPSSSLYLQPQTPTPGGSAVETGFGVNQGHDSLFVTPVGKVKQKKDKKGKGKAIATETPTAASGDSPLAQNGEAMTSAKKTRAKTTPKKKGKDSVESPTPEPPAASNSVSSPSSKTTPKSKKRKRASPSPDPATSTPSTSTSAAVDGTPVGSSPSRGSTSPTKKKKRPLKAKKTPSEPATPSNPAQLTQSVQEKSNVASPPLTLSAIPASFNRYKPHRPSPLGRMSEPPAEAPQQEPTLVSTPKKRKRRVKKQETRVGSEPATEVEPAAPSQIGADGHVENGQMDAVEADQAENSSRSVPPPLIEYPIFARHRNRWLLYSFPLSWPEYFYGRPGEADRRFSSSAIDRRLPEPFAMLRYVDNEDSEMESEELEEEELARSPSPTSRPADEVEDGTAEPIAPISPAESPVQDTSPVQIATNVPQEEAPPQAETSEVTAKQVIEGQVTEGQAKITPKRARAKNAKQLSVLVESPAQDIVPADNVEQMEDPTDRDLASSSSITAEQGADIQPVEKSEATRGGDDHNGGVTQEEVVGTKSTNEGSAYDADAVPAHQPASPITPITPVTPVSAVSSTSSSALDNPKVRTHIHSSHHLALAARGQCVICAGPPHLQKDCPAVRSGLESLRELLELRKQEKKTPLRESSIEAIETWVERLDRITNSVNGIKPASPTVPSRLPVISPVPGTVPSSLPIKRQAVREKSRSPEPAKSTIAPPVLSSPSPSISPEPEAIKAAPTVAQPPPLLREHSLPPIHLKALASKAGSVSGLSVSDAVIETGSSASESEDESGIETDTDNESVPGPADSDTESTSSKATSRSASSIRSTRSIDDKRPDVTKLDSQASLMDFLTAPLSQKQKRSARLSAANMHDIDYDEAQDASDIEDSPEPSPAGPYAKKARRGSESSVGEFEEDVLDPAHQGEGDYKEEDDDDVLPFSQAPSLWPIRGGEAESIEPDLPVDEVDQAASPQPTDQARRSFTDMAEGSSPSQAIADLPGSIALQEAIDEDAIPERWVDNPSSAEKQKEDEGRTGHVISQGLMSPPSSAGGSRHSRHQDHNPQEPLRATQLQQSPSQPEDAESTPRPLTRRVTRSKASQEEPLSLDSAIDLHINGIPSSSQLTAPASPPRRRLRSASREPTIEPPSPRVGSTTRRISSSQPMPASASTSSRRLRSQSPSSSLPVRRSTRHTTPLDQIDELASSPAQPTRRSTRRGTTPLRSSQVDELESSPPPASSARLPEPIPEEADAEVDGSDGRDQTIQATPEGLKTPLVPETQVDPESASQPPSQTQSQRRRSLRGDPSPLFMTQGSQIPQTQAYNLYPNLSSSEIGLGETPRSKTGGIGLLSSPISEKKLGGQSSKSANGTAPLGRRVSFKASSPIYEADEGENDDGPAATPKGNGPVVSPARTRNDTDDAAMEPMANGHGRKASDSPASEDEGVSDIPLLPARRQLRHSTSTPALYPPLPVPSRVPRSQSPSQAPSVSLFPTLGSLPREQLRSQFASLSQSETSRRPRASLPANMTSMSQPVRSTTTSSAARSGRASFGGRTSTPLGVNGNGKGRSNGFKVNGNGNGNRSESDSSGSSDSDSDEEKTPAGLKGRIARGDQNKKKKRVSGQPPVVRW
ncbi:hypothetical protein IAU59_004503 [Kwoniella sp. CBS 9459]